MTARGVWAFQGVRSRAPCVGCARRRDVRCPVASLPACLFCFSLTRKIATIYHFRRHRADAVPPRTHAPAVSSGTEQHQRDGQPPIAHTAEQNGLLFLRRRKETHVASHHSRYKQWRMRRLSATG